MLWYYSVAAVSTCFRTPLHVPCTDPVAYIVPTYLYNARIFRKDWHEPAYLQAYHTLAVTVTASLHTWAVVWLVLR